MAESLRTNSPINDKPHALKIEPRVTLLDTLREYLEVTGTRKGCNHGQCGSAIGPLGAKGVDKLSIVGVPAAIANAIFHATGKRIRELPITPDKLL